MVESLGIGLRRLGAARQRLAFGLGHQAQREVGELFELADVGKHRTVVRTIVVDKGNGGGWFPRLGHGAHSLQLDVVNVYPRSLYAQIDRSGMTLDAMRYALYSELAGVAKTEAYLGEMQRWMASQQTEREAAEKV